MNFDERDNYQNDNFNFGGNNQKYEKSDCCYKAIEKSCYCCPVKWEDNKNYNDKKEDDKCNNKTDWNDNDRCCEDKKEYNCECRCRYEEKKEEKCENQRSEYDNKNKCCNRGCNRNCCFRGFRF